MIKKVIFTLAFIGTLSFSFANEADPEAVYEQMVSIFKGEWTLSPKEKQIDTTGAHKHKAIAHLVGTKERALSYKSIGRGSTLQEELLPNTLKEMVTMYHCDSFAECTELRATHYCAKQNQPQFILNTKETTKNKFVFDCDMKTELCNSVEDHIHTIILELSEDGNHLKSSYLGWTEQKPNKKNSIYHFDRK